MVCKTKHRDICPDCGEPRIVTCEDHGHCGCIRMEIPDKELIVGYRFKSDIVNGTYSPIFKGASGGTIIINEIPLSGQVWKYKIRNKWIVKCFGCGEEKTSLNNHSWLTKWAYKHRCENRIDIP